MGPTSLSDMPTVVLNCLIPYLSDNSRTRLKSTNSKFYQICTNYERLFKIHPECEIKIEWNTWTSVKSLDVENSCSESLDLMDLTHCPHFFAKRLIISRPNLDWFARKPKLAPEILNFSMFTASVLESLYLDNIALRKVWLLDFLEKSKKLKIMSITNCSIDEPINVGTELLPVIPKVLSLNLVETAEFLTDKKTAKLLKNHVLKNAKFEKLKIDPFYPFKTKKEIDNLEEICDSVVEISHFHGLFCNRSLLRLRYEQANTMNGVQVDYTRNIFIFEFILIYKLCPLCLVFFAFHHSVVISFIFLGTFILSYLIFYIFYYINSYFWRLNYRCVSLLQKCRFWHSNASPYECLCFFKIHYIFSFLFNTLLSSWNRDAGYYHCFLIMVYWVVTCEFVQILGIFALILIQKDAELFLPLLYWLEDFLFITPMFFSLLKNLFEIAK